MSRLQKKCFIGATGFHLFLLVLLFVGPAFFVADKVDDTPVLEIVPDMTTDKDMKGGGPNQRQAVQPPVQTQTPQLPPQQPVQPPRADPKPPVEKPVEKVVPKEIEKVEPVKDSKPDPSALATDKRQPHKVQVSDTVVKIKDRKPTTTSTADSRAAAKAAAERSRQFASAAKALREGLSQTTTIETSASGFGGGGPSYANYTQVVRKIYNDAWNAWSVPDDVTDDEATVQVSVTISQDGRVVSSRILRSSGSRAVISAAQAVLDRVTFVKEFPAGSKDTERTFTMTFKLNAKKSLG